MPKPDPCKKLACAIQKCLSGKCKNSIDTNNSNNYKIIITSYDDSLCLLLSLENKLLSISIIFLWFFTSIQRTLTSLK